ncbi:50S ribosomal protein 5 alpha, chloroplastic isoform X2 [Amborella trichopoda]|uniref:50S ribosomal protein 5 alpha, chloroplastic isoform X2 n=1 Tax=Amborella trichopoda TaxID=13333 RepID=UPI0009BF85DE|nr:50S ribosomal protein 5 alpha, chloroplastic isoform X2 [Amborella trichopoda]|eukprot:XP_006854431.2 50S ribosomal protein 5 alpha, chloroplastic isoform X2 [Amborella trichopoda]
MALSLLSASLLSPPSSLLSLPSSFLSSSRAVPFTFLSASRFQGREPNLQFQVVNGVGISRPFRSLEVRASSGLDGEVSEGDNEPEKSSEESVSVENLPLESKLQEKLAAKLRMKLAKKIRLRRKRLLRKRRLRKKGRWPPSKMKKLKNDKSED